MPAKVIPISDPTLYRDVRQTEAARAVIAHAVVEGARKIGKKTPTKAKLARAITEIDPESHIKGASALKIGLDDAGFALLDSGFLTAASKKGKLDPIDVNYPPNTRYWWRSTQLSVASDHTIQMTFMDRVAAMIAEQKGPLKANRGATTRAEFLKLLATKHQTSAVEFYSQQLDTKQPVSAPSASSTQSSGSSSSGSKSPGIGANTKGLTSHGVALDSGQLAKVNLILAAGDQLHAPLQALEAAIYAAMGESDLGKTSSNVFETTGVPTAYGGGSDTAGQAHGFFTGGTSFGSPGAIAAANRGDAVWQIANETEVNAVWIRSRGDSYAGQYPGGQAQGLAEAARIVQAGGGPGGSGSIESIQPYNFAVGSSSNPNEDFWTAMQRLADEVNWALFTDGNRIYYDSQMTLIRQKPAASFTRKDPAVIDWNYDWDTRQIATQLTLHLICDPFQFHAGEVFHLREFGPASEMSSADLPGRWLISDIIRNLGDPFSEFTLVQPSQPKREPAASTTSVSVGGAGSSSTTTGSHGLTNPAPGATWGRLDMGFDGNYGSAGAVAPFDGTIEGIGISGWPGDGRYFAVKNDDQSGPDYTRAMYFAEGATPIYSNGTHVKAGQKIGTPVSRGGNGSPGNFEIGPANTSNFDTLAKSYGLGSGGARSMVLSFYNWLRSAGAGTTTDDSVAGNH